MRATLVLLVAAVAACGGKRGGQAPAVDAAAADGPAEAPPQVVARDSAAEPAVLDGSGLEPARESPAAEALAADAADGGAVQCRDSGDCPGGWQCCVSCAGDRRCAPACTGEVCPTDAATDTGGFTCGQTSCSPQQICVHVCTCGGPFVCMPRGDAGACPAGTGNCTRNDGQPGCSPLCNNPPPRCMDVPAACGGTPTNSCLRGICFGNVVQPRQLLCACAP